MTIMRAINVRNRPMRLRMFCRWRALGALPGRKGCLPTSPRAPTWRLARKLSQGKTVVALAPDTDKNYFSMALFEGE